MKKEELLKAVEMGHHLVVERIPSANADIRMIWEFKNLEGENVYTHYILEDGKETYSDPGWQKTAESSTILRILLENLGLDIIRFEGSRVETIRW